MIKTERDRERVSIIIPVYNVKDYLADCLDSVLAQTYKEIETILIDDGSADGSGELCDRYAAADSRIRVLHQENRGLSAARNAGNSLASGEYILYVDSDDLLHPACVEKLYSAVKECEADCAVCAAVSFVKREKFDLAVRKDRKDRQQKISLLSGREAAAEVIRDTKWERITVWGKLFSRKLLSYLDFPEGKIHEDEFVNYKTYFCCAKVAVVDFPGYGVRSRAGSLTSSYSLKNLDRIQAFSEAIDWLKEQNDLELETYARIRYLVNLQITWYRVETELKGESESEQIRQDLIAAHRKFYDENWKRIRGKTDFMRKVSIEIFRFDPHLFQLISGCYLLVNRYRK